MANGYNSYLDDAQYFWTISSYSGDTMWAVNPWGNLTTGNDVDRAKGVRPVINISPNSTIIGGSGTLSDYYVLGKKKAASDDTGTIIDARIGEYVKFNNKTYRVVENGIATKLILDGYYQETA